MMFFGAAAYWATRNMHNTIIKGPSEPIPPMVFTAMGVIISLIGVAVLLVWLGEKK